MKLNKVLATVVVGLVGFSAHATVKLELAPLQLGVKAQVLGVRVGFSGQKAIAYTGNTAVKLAKLSGKVALKSFDASKQMLVATGSEASDLVLGTYSNVGHAGRVVLATGGAFAGEAVNLATSAIHAGEAVISLKPGKGAKIVASGVANAATDTTTLVVGGAVEIVDAGTKVISGSAKAAFKTLGIARQTVKSSSSF